MVRVARPISVPSRCRGGFSLAEALVALALAAMASSSLLLASYASMYHTSDALDRALAVGVADQLLDEITGLPYKEKGTSAYSAVLGPESGESSRAQFDDIDDYNGYAESGTLHDQWKIQLGQGDDTGGIRDPSFCASTTYFQWHAEVSVVYLNEGDVSQKLGTGLTSGLRKVDVLIKSSADANGRELARVSRVVGYAPSE